SCPALSGDGPLNTTTLSTFPKDGVLTYTVTVKHTVDDTYTDVGLNTEITLPDTPAGMVEVNEGNNTSNSAQRTRNNSANLNVTVAQQTIASPATNCPGDNTVYTPGCEARYTVEFSNAGPDAASNAKISFSRYETGGGNSFTWTCSASGTV